MQCGLFVVSGAARAQPERNPQLVRHGKREAFRHHAHDGRGLAAKTNEPPDDAGIA